MTIILRYTRISTLRAIVFRVSMKVQIIYTDDYVKRDVTILNPSDDVLEKLYSIEDEILPELVVRIERQE